MKMIKRTGFLTLSVCLLFLGISTVKAQKLTRHTITMGAQNQKAAYGGFADLITGNVYSLSNIAGHQSTIDLIYAYGSKTTINLMMPSSTGLQYFGSVYKTQVYAAWKKKNRGSIVVLENNKENRKLYKTVKTNQQLEDAYSHAASTIKNRPGYSRTSHGPSARVRHINIGDYILIKSRDRGIYAIGRVVNGEKGYTGNVTIDFKVTTKQ